MLAAHVVGFGGNALLFRCSEWPHLRESLLELFDPLLHFQVLFTLLAMPLSWVLAGLAAVGFLGGAALGGRHSEEP